MLEIQRYLRSGGDVESLDTDLGVYAYRHPALPLVGFKYNQIQAPRHHPIVCEARGIVLEEGTWNLVAKPFNRFFNPGEDPKGYAVFDWSDFHCNTKEDGSLIILFHYADEWHVHTSGSVGLGNAGTARAGTWRELFWQTTNIDCSQLAPKCTYVFELCTTANKVIRVYPKPTAYLLGIFGINGDEAREWSPRLVDFKADRLGVPRPEQHDFHSEAEIRAFLEHKASTDKTFEGVVIRDRNGVRFKLKSESYLRLHHLHDNGNIFNPKRLIPVILAGEKDEVISYFPEVRGPLEATEAELEAEFQELAALWRQTWQIEAQRDFALAIVKTTPHSGILFNLRKIYGEHQTEDLLRDQWNRSAETIVKRYCERMKIA